MPIGELDPNIQRNTLMENVLDTLQGINNARKGWLDNQASQAALPYVSPQAQANLQNTQLGNQKLQALLPYVGPQAAADLVKIQLANKYYPQDVLSQINERNAQAGYLGAETGKTNAEIKFLPLEDLIKAQNASQLGQRFGGAYQMARALSQMSPASRATWIANNQNSYNQMISDLGNRTNASYITPQVMQQFFPGMIQPASTSNINPVNQLFRPPTSDLNAQTQLASQMSANKDLTTGKTRTQNEGAIQVENFLNSPTFQNTARNAAEYAGAYGKGKAAISALSQTNPKAYEDYINFGNQQMPLLMNRIKTLEGMGATDKQREELYGIYNKAINSFTSNPAQFIQQVNNLIDNLNTVGESVQKSSNPLFNVNRLQGIKPISTENITIPSFNSKKEFQSWFMSLSPTEKAAVKSKLGEK